MTDVRQQPTEHPSSAVPIDLPPVPPPQPDPTLITYIERGIQPELAESRARKR